MLSAHRTLAALALSRGKSAPILTTTSHAAPRGRWNILGTSPEIISLGGFGNDRQKSIFEDDASF